MKERVYIWDPLVRLFHWSLVLSFIVAYVTGEDESLTHVNAGYMVMGLVGFRIIWGFIGSKHARFTDFIASPATAIRYGRELVAGKARHYLGHNPLGGWMILALLTGLALTSYSGLALYGAEGHGPLAQAVNRVTYATVSNPLVLRVNGRDDDDDEHSGRRHSGLENHEENEAAEEFWEEIHEFFANFTLLLVLLHIAGVIVSSARESQNLVRAMITGYKSPKSEH